MPAYSGTVCRACGMVESVMGDERMTFINSSVSTDVDVPLEC